MSPDVSAAQALPNFKLLLEFFTGKRPRFDVEPLLNFPVYQCLLKAGYFFSARVENGTLVWDEQCDLSPDSIFLQGEPVLAESNLNV